MPDSICGVGLVCTWSGYWH